MYELSSFDSIEIGIASPEKIRSWSKGEVTKSVFSVKRFLDQLKTGNVIVENTRELDTKALYVKSVESKLQNLK